MCMVVCVHVLYIWLRSYIVVPVNLLSMELTYFCSGLLFAAVVRRWVWDYALTVTLLHVLLTSLGETRTHTHRNAYTCLNSLTHTHTGLTQNDPLLAEQSAQGQL